MFNKEEQKINDDLFHKHLDNCNQCMNQPFNLCKIGSDILHTTENKKKK